MARTGRRPGGADTRGEILAAARQEFSSRGYAGATIRGIAAEAGVDPALIHHYFGTKRELFVVTLQLPFDPAALVGAVMEGPAEQIGERIIRGLLTVWGTERGQAMMQAVVRSALTDTELLGVLREFMLETVLLPIAREHAPDEVALRATLLASQVMGVAMVRHVAQIEPLASADAEVVVAAVGPTLQGYLTGPLRG